MLVFQLLFNIIYMIINIFNITLDNIKKFYIIINKYSGFSKSKEADMLNGMDERMSILKMVEENKINALQGIQLLEALGKGAKTNPAKAAETGEKPRFMRVLVTNLHTGKAKVQVTLPFSLVSWGLRIGAQFSPEIAGMDLEKIEEALQASAGAKIVDVIDEEDGEHVEIYVD